MTEKTKIIIIAAVVVVLAFVGGTACGKHTATKGVNNDMMANGQFGAGRFAGANGGMRGPSGMNGGFVSGTVLSKDANGLTIQNQAGGSKIVLLSPNTTVAKSAQGTLNDVAVGSMVTIIGTTNSDGSVTAQSVQIRPASPAGAQGSSGR